MTTLLHRSLAGLVLLAGLSFGNPVSAAASAPTADPQVQVRVHAATPVQLAWQRVGSPLSFNA